MKNKFNLAALLLIILVSCSKTDKQPNTVSTLPAAPETKPAYDNTSFGVYKGVIVGSSGTIVFRINNGDNIVKGYLTVDDLKDTLSTTATIDPGSAINNVLFTGNISSMKVTANADGSNASISDIQIEGHENVTGIIRHEKSTQQIYCYEGTFSGSASGIITATRIGITNNNDSAFFLTKVTSVNDTNLYRGFDGVYLDTTRTYLYNSDVQIAQVFSVVGIFTRTGQSPNDLSGSWTGNYGSGQFTTHRTY